MSDYVIKGKTSDRNGRLVVIDESTWTVELDQTPTPNWDSYSGNYFAEVTNSKKLVFLRRADGQIKAYGNVDPTLFWDEKTDDSYWQANPFVQSYLDPVWNGSAWEVTNSGTGTQNASFIVKGTSDWNVNYRPYYAKIEYTLSGGGDVESIGFLGDASGRGTVSSASAEDEALASGSGILMLKIWQGKDNVRYLHIGIPAGETLTVTGIYFSKLKFNDYVCDGYGYADVAFDNATEMTGTEPNFDASLEIYGITSRVYTEWGSYASGYTYNAATFTVSDINPLSITVQSSTPQNPPKVSIFSDRSTYLIGNNEYGYGWKKSGTETVTFNWTPPSAGTYAVMVYNDSTLDWGEQCDTFSVAIEAGETQEPSGDCEGYATEFEAMNNTVSGTLATEHTWSVDANSYLAMYYGDGTDLGGTVDVNATADTAFTVNLMQQTYGDLSEIVNSTFYWGPSGNCSGNANGSGESTTWSSEPWDCYSAGTGTQHVRILAYNGTDGGNWVVGKEPDKIKVEFTGPATLDIMVLSGSNGDLCEEYDYVSGTEVELTNWDGGGEGANEIEMFLAEAPNGSPFVITKIELIYFGQGSLEWSISSLENSQANGAVQEVITSFDPNNDWRLMLENSQSACVDIDMTVTHSGAAGASFTEYTDPTYWAAGPGSWSGSAWEPVEDFGEYELSLDSQNGSDGGAWTSGYQPTQFRIFFTGNIMYIGLSPYDGMGSNIENPVSGQAYAAPSFAHGGDYIYQLNAYNPEGSFTITGIEFSEDPFIYPCQEHTSIEDACNNTIYTTSDLDSEHRITVGSDRMGAIQFVELPSESGWVTFTVVNEDNPTTAGFTIGAYEPGFPGEFIELTTDTTSNDTAVVYVDGGSNPYIHLVIHNTGGAACEEFSINVSFS